ncbi:MAG: hypothetical protein AB7K09_17835, partial [Planctomycetota bacterium]
PAHRSADQHVHQAADKGLGEDRLPVDLEAAFDGPSDRVKRNSPRLPDYVAPAAWHARPKQSPPDESKLPEDRHWDNQRQVLEVKQVRYPDISLRQRNL